MRVQIKADVSIPPGFTYTRCDTYTAEQLLTAATPGGMGRGDKRRVNLNAVEYIAAHPKEIYTSEDLFRIRERRPLRIGIADAVPQKDQKAATGTSQRRMVRRERDLRTDPIRSDDLSLKDAQILFGLSEATLSVQIRIGGMPYRKRSKGGCGYFFRLPEVREYLEKLPFRTGRQQKMLDILRGAEA